MHPTWKPVRRIPVSSDVVVRAVSIIRATFSGEASSSYNVVPSLISIMFGFKNGYEMFSNTMDCIYWKETPSAYRALDLIRKAPIFLLCKWLHSDPFFLGFTIINFTFQPQCSNKVGYVRQQTRERLVVPYLLIKCQFTGKRRFDHNLPVFVREYSSVASDLGVELGGFHI